MGTLSSPARPQSTLLPPPGVQLFPVNDCMDFATTSTFSDELNSIWTPKVAYTDVSGVSHDSSPWKTEPHLWSKTQVWQWLLQVTEAHRIDITSFPFLNFDIDGHQLCNMGYQDFVQAAGSAGHTLFHSFVELKWNGASGRQCFGELECPDPSFACHERGDFYVKFPNIIEGPETETRKSCSPPLESLASDISTTPLFPVPAKKRSRKVPRQRKKHCPRGAHLWEFIRDILLNREHNPGLIRWEDRTAGVFRLLKSEAVAQLWGKKKNNSSMTYEKLSRAMRYYYKRGILERVDGKRLVYKFGANAGGWKASEN